MIDSVGTFAFFFQKLDCGAANRICLTIFLVCFAASTPHNFGIIFSIAQLGLFRPIALIQSQSGVLVEFLVERRNPKTEYKMNKG